MSVQQFMSGRELPCNVLDLLNIRPMPLPGPLHESLVVQIAAGQAYPDLHYKLGLSHLARQELGLAMRCFETAVQARADYGAARLALAGTYDLLARPADAAQQIDAVLKTITPAAQNSAASPASRYVLLCAAAFCLEKVGDLPAALHHYTQALSADEISGGGGPAGPSAVGDLFARYRLAAICLSHNRLEEAVEHHRAILTAEPQEAAVRTSLAHLLQLLGRHNEAVWEYQKALCLAPDCWELQLELSCQFERMGDSQQAIAHLRQLAERYPHFPDLHLRLANLHSSRGEDENAQEQYDAALSLHPDYLECRIALARHELKCGRTESSLEHFHRAATINQQNVEAYAGLAVAQHRLGRIDEAKETLAAAWKIAGNTDVLIAQLGLLELQAEAADNVNAAFDPERQSEDAAYQDNDEHARPARDPLSEVSQQVQPAMFNQPIGVSDDSTSGDSGSQSFHLRPEMQRQWLESQVQRYTEILHQHPTWADVHVRRGMLLKLLGRLDEAKTAFEVATAQNPGYTAAWVQLGLLQQQAGNARGAIDALETAIQIEPTYADLHYRLALIYCNELEFELAMERLEQAVAINGDNPDFRRQLWVALQGLQLTGRRTASASPSPLPDTFSVSEAA